MQELIDKLKAEANITTEQAEKVLQTIRNFVVEKFPMMGGAIDSLLANGKKDNNDPLDV